MIGEASTASSLPFVLMNKRNTLREILTTECGPDLGANGKWSKLKLERERERERERGEKHNRMRLRWPPEQAGSLECRIAAGNKP